MPESSLIREQESVREEHYGDLPKEEGIRRAAAHLAASIITAPYGSDPQEIRASILGDRAGDLGADFVAVVEADEPPVVIVLQAKDGSSVPLSEQKAALLKLLEFRDVIGTEVGLQRANEQRREEAAAIRALSDRVPRFAFYLVLTGSDEQLLKEEDYAHHLDANTSIEILNQSTLNAAFERDVMGIDVGRTDVTLDLEDEWTRAIAVPGSPAVIHTLIDAAHYADKTREHGAALFRYNPRLFLGPNKGPNGKMLTVLKGPERHNFHLFNNGITAIAKGQPQDEELGNGKRSVKFQDFQVVNGCQTTETLWRWRLTQHEDSPDGAKSYVSVRIVLTDDSELAHTISIATNTQSAVQNADTTSQHPLQRRIKHELENFAEPPFFYETRRGAWKQEQKQNKGDRYLVKGTVPRRYRKITMKELAQALMAAKGEPDRAKEYVVMIFKDLGPDSDYTKLFGNFDDISQLALIVELNNAIADLGRWGSTIQTSVNRKFASLGKYLLLHLVYEYWRSQGDPFNPEKAIQHDALVIPTASKEIMDRFDDSLSEIAMTAFRSILQSYEELAATDEGVRTGGHRKFLRSKEARRKAEHDFRRVVKTIGLSGNNL
jgi:hypothetical protein